MKKFPSILDGALSSRSPVGWRSTALVLAVLSIFALADSAFAQDDPTVQTILSFGTMIGDPGSGPSNVIRGYSGPPAPWVIHSVMGTLKTDGSLTVTVRGLVLTNNTNPVPFFRAALSCQDPANSNKGKLFFTKEFRADANGNSDIVGTVSLPSKCVAPIVLITSPPVMNNFDGFWFAVTGR
jgi:hypothetical protein